MKPKYQHDCKTCVFLGGHTAPESSLYYDLYYCLQYGMPTVLARYGDPDHEYLSGAPMSFQRSAFLDKNNTSPLAEAYRRAIEKGYFAKKGQAHV